MPTESRNYSSQVLRQVVDKTHGHSLASTSGAPGPMAKRLITISPLPDPSPVAGREGILAPVVDVQGGMARESKLTGGSVKAPLPAPQPLPPAGPALTRRAIVVGMLLVAFV